MEEIGFDTSFALYFILCVSGRVCMCVRARTRMHWQTYRYGKYGMHVEAREQHQVLVLAFYFV